MAGVLLNLTSCNALSLQDVFYCNAATCVRIYG